MRKVLILAAGAVVVLAIALVSVRSRRAHEEGQAPVLAPGPVVATAADHHLAASRPGRRVHAPKQAPGPTAIALVSAAPEPSRDLPDLEMEAELQPHKPWPGPWPESVAELPKTPETARRLAKFESVHKLDSSLKFLGDLRRCLGPSVHSTGGIYVELWFDVDRKGKATGSRVAVLGSSLDPDDDAVVIRCLEANHIGRTFVWEQWTPEAEDGHIVEKDAYTIRTAINIPVENEPLYPALLGPEAVTD